MPHKSWNVRHMASIVYYTLFPSPLNTVQCYYNVVNFLKNPDKGHPTARPLGWGMRCLLLVQSLIYVVPGHCCKVWNIMLYWTELQQHSTVLKICYNHHHWFRPCHHRFRPCLGVIKQEPITWTMAITRIRNRQRDKCTERLTAACFI